VVVDAETKRKVKERVDQRLAWFSQSWESPPLSNSPMTSQEETLLRTFLTAEELSRIPQFSGMFSGGIAP
jgi:hypothetical protein